MKYRIKESEIHGINRPLLLYSGWIESSAKKLVIETDGEVAIELEFKETKTKVHTFSIRKPLLKNKKSASYIVYAVSSDGTKVKIDEFFTTPFTRAKMKLSPKQRGKYRKAVDTEHKFELKNTIDMRDDKGYQEWILKHETFTDVKNWEYQPLISIVMPVYNVDAKYLKACIDSILNQTYQNFEICIADDCSTKEETIQTLKEYAEKDKRIKVLFREKNGHISEATNSALTLATGEFIGLMDNDDALMPQALNEVVAVLNTNQNLDFIYSDEDKVDPEGNRSDPHFKPDFALEKLYGGNYICHFSVIRKSIIEQVGGFRKGYEGAQDFDLFIRIAEVTNRFYHIPKILYHWRMIPGSTAIDAGQKNYAGEAGKRALEDLFEKKGIQVQIDIIISTHYFVQYILNCDPKALLVMYVNEVNDSFMLRISNIKNDLSYQNYKFVFFTKNHIQLKQLLNNCLASGDFDVIQCNENRFMNYLNKYIENSLYDVLVGLDENMKFCNFDSLETLISYAMRPEIGFVGCKVLNEYHLVTDSGYFLVNKKLLPTHYLTYMNDYGFYGNLLVPNNYRIIENKCFAVEIEKWKKIANEVEKENFDDEFVRKCMSFDRNSFKNIVIPSVEVFVEKEHTQLAISSALLDDLNNEGFEVDYDRYYNVNLSDVYGFRLDK